MDKKLTIYGGIKIFITFLILSAVMKKVGFIDYSLINIPDGFIYFILLLAVPFGIDKIVDFLFAYVAELVRSWKKNGS